MRPSKLTRRLATLVLMCALTAGLSGGPIVVLGASGDPPTILFAGELASALSYHHIVVLYNKRLDETVPIPLGDFTITVDGVASAPASASYLLSGLAGIFDESGSTFLRLNLPTGVTVGATSTVQLDYRQGAAPLRDLSLTPAMNQSGPAQVGSMGDFAFLGALVDAGNASNRLTLLFTGQVDLSSMPLPGDFSVSVDGSPVTVSSVEPRVPDIGMGIVDLVLPMSVTSGARVAMAYAPGANKFRARNGGLVVDAYSQTAVTVLVPPTTASQTVAAGGTVATGTGNPPSPADPLTTSVTTSDGGLITINETPADPAPAGYTFFGEQVQITAPPASDPQHPLVLVFSLDATLVPSGQDQNSIAIFRNGTPLPTCTTDPISAPCVASRVALSGGDIQITVKTLAASRWNFAVVVPYVFGGFKSPVNGGAVRNLAKAGSAIPIRFGLGGNRGLTIFTAGSPASQHVACDTSSPIDAIDQTVSAGSSSLSYDAGSGTYSYIWKTDPTWTGCRALTLSFGDGSRQTAMFQFR